MKTLLLAGMMSAAMASGAWAANARNPYGNIDHRNDAGNDTGDARVEALNQAQLDSNGIPAAPAARTAPGGVYQRNASGGVYPPNYGGYGNSVYAPRPVYAPPAGYYPPPPGYYAPPAAYYPPPAGYYPPPGASYPPPAANYPAGTYPPAAGYPQNAAPYPPQQSGPDQDGY